MTIIRKLLATLRRDQAGNFAYVFAMALVPIMGLFGSAIDYSRGQYARLKMQSVIDSAVLAGAKGGASTEDEDRVAAAQHFFNENKSNSHFSEQSAASFQVIGGQTIKGTATLRMDTSFMQLLGKDQIDIAVEAEAVIQSGATAEIALVLDYSGSMKTNGKYIAMRDAAKNLVADLLGNDGDTGDRIKIALVPFSEYVYTDMSTTYIRDVHPDKYGHTVSACLDSRRHSWNIEDTTPEAGTQDSKWPAPGMPVVFREAGALNGDAVNGEIDPAECEAGAITYDVCENRRSHFRRWGYHLIQVCTQVTVYPDICQRTYNTTEEGAQGDEAVVSDFAAETPQCAVYSTNSLKMLPLTADKSALDDRLDAMTPVKLTNIALGLEMGWHMVAPNAPFTDASDYNDGTLKAIVLLTDGKQTVGGFGPGSVFTVERAEKNTEDLCEAIKEKGVKMITVAFDLDDQQTRTRLENCASGPGYYFEAETNSDIAAVFQQITEQLSGPVRLVR